MLDADFWQDKTISENYSKEKKLFDLISSYSSSIKNWEDINDLYNLALMKENLIVQMKFSKYKRSAIYCEKEWDKLFLSNEIDSLDCYIEIHAGAGGTGKSRLGWYA